MVRSLILASASTVRHNLLKQAGVPHNVVVSKTDEASIKLVCSQEGVSTEDTATRLANAKAEDVGKEFTQALVLGADQILECNGKRFDKPDNLITARQQLEQLRGQRHYLINSTVVWADGRMVWSHRDVIEMSMRPLTDLFIDKYLESVGGLACSSVGAYQLEGLGAQLFNKTTGDFFSILGLPLLPLMEFLRQNDVLTE